MQTNGNLRPWLSYLDELQERAISVDLLPGRSLSEYLHLYWLRFLKLSSLVCSIRKHTDAGFQSTAPESRTICGKLTIRGTSLRTSNTSRAIYKITAPRGLRFNVSFLSLKENFEAAEYIGCGFNDIVLKSYGSILATLCGNPLQETMFTPNDTFEVHTYRSNTESSGDDSNFFSLQLEYQVMGRIETMPGILVSSRFIEQNHNIDKYWRAGINGTRLNMRLAIQHSWHGSRISWGGRINYENQPGNFPVGLQVVLSMQAEEVSCRSHVMSYIVSVISQFLFGKCLKGKMASETHNHRVFSAGSCEGYSTLFGRACAISRHDNNKFGHMSGYSQDSDCDFTEDIHDTWYNILQRFNVRMSPGYEITQKCHVYAPDEKDLKMYPLLYLDTRVSYQVLAGRQYIHVQGVIRIWSFRAKQFVSGVLDLRAVNLYIPEQGCTGRDNDTLKAFDGPNSGIVTSEGVTSHFVILRSLSCVDMAHTNITSSLGDLTVTWSNKLIDNVTISMIFQHVLLECPGKSCLLVNTDVLDGGRVDFIPTYKPAVHLFHFTTPLSDKGIKLHIEVDRMAFAGAAENCDVSGLYLLQRDLKMTLDGLYVMPADLNIKLKAAFCTPEAVAMLNTIMQQGGWHIGSGMLIVVRTYPEVDHVNFSMSYTTSECLGAVNPVSNYYTRGYATPPCPKLFTVNGVRAVKFGFTKCCFMIYRLLSDAKTNVNWVMIDHKSLFSVQMLMFGLRHKSSCCKVLLSVTDNIRNPGTYTCHLPNERLQTMSAFVEFVPVRLGSNRRDKCSHVINVAWQATGAVCVDADHETNSSTLTEWSSTVFYNLDSCGFLAIRPHHNVMIHFSPRYRDTLFGTISYLIAVVPIPGGTPTTLFIDHLSEAELDRNICRWPITLLFEKPSVFYFIDSMYVAVHSSMLWSDLKLTIGFPSPSLAFKYSRLDGTIGNTERLHSVNLPHGDVEIISCGEGDTTFSSRCHVLNGIEGKKFSWNAARNACTSRGWDLLSLNSDVEWNTIVQLLSSYCVGHRIIFLGLQASQSVCSA